MKWAKQTGFTIVELLIVIVVIAILATITTVAYTGISQRANAAMILSSVDTWEKSLRIAAVEGATLPTGCLGDASDFPAGDGFATGTCVAVYGDDGALQTSVVYQGSSWDNWPESMQRPSGKLPAIRYDVTGGYIKGRGAWVLNSNPSTRTVIIAWITQEQGQCGRGTIAIPGGGSTFQDYCALRIDY